MKAYKAYIQATTTKNDEFISILREEVLKRKYAIMSICAAYASYSGIILIRELLSHFSENRSRWLIGLDDHISDPNAIRIALGMRNADVRIAKMLPKARFHAKVFLLETLDHDRATLIIGSNNLTESALVKNCEAYVYRRADSKSEVRELRSFWDHLWKQGRQATEDIIAEYERQRKKKRPQISDVENESALKRSLRKKKETSAAMLQTTSTVWIELGKNTGGGGQLDIVKHIAPFLGLPDSPSQGQTAQLKMRTPKGFKTFNLTFTKGMWRFMSLQQGFVQPLRPNLNKPSPYILVIGYSNGNKISTMSVIKNNSKEANELIDRSHLTGFVGKSVPNPHGRNFGWV
jgi:HKD family nuclease